MKTLVINKNYPKALLSFLLVLVGANTYAQTNTHDTEFEKIAQRFAPPCNVQKEINNTAYWSPLGLHVLSTGPEGSVYFTKKQEIDRVINAQRIRTVIKQNNITTITVPEKYIYKKNGTWGVMAKAIEIDDEINDDFFKKPYTAEEMKDLIKLQECMCYMDLHSENLVRDKKTNKIVIIDTEDRSFAGSQRFGERSKLECVKSLQKHLYTDDEAYQLLNERIKELKETDDGSRKRNFLQEAKRFDEPGIDFEKIKKNYVDPRRF